MVQKFLAACALAVAVVILSPAVSHANRGYTVEGHFACLKQAWYHDFYAYASFGHKKKIKQYLDDRKCAMLKGGLKVKVTDPPGLFGSTTGFAVYGVKLWTDSFGIRY